MKNIDVIRDILGGDVSARLLQPEQLAQYNAQKKGKSSADKNPLGWLLECKDGRKFKAYEAEPENQYRLDSYALNCRVLEGETFVPGFVHHSPEFLIVEFVDGSFPDMQEARFSEALGKVLARLHQVGTGLLPFQCVFAGDEFFLDELMRWRVFSPKQATRVKEVLAASAPAVFRTSMVYADIKPDNYCWDGNGELVLFDLGSFQQGRITDYFLVGNSFFDTLDRELFLGAYKEAGGDASWLKYEQCLRGLNSLKMLWFYEAQRRFLPLFALRKRRAYRGWAQALRDRFISEFGV